MGRPQTIRTWDRGAARPPSTIEVARAVPRPRGVRRRVMACVLLAWVVGVAASCGGGDDDASSAPTSTGGAQTTASSGSSTTASTVPAFDPDGEVTVGVVVGGASLDPHKGPNAGEHIYSYPVYDRLTKINDDFGVDPMLATSWRFADDGAYLEVELRDDVTFHDGTPFDANAVKANILRAKEADSTTAPAVAAVTSVEVVDPDTVRLMLSSPAPDLPAQLSGGAGMMISPAAIADPTRDLANDPGDAGSGPYKVVAWTPRERAEYEPAQPAGEHWDQGAGLLRHLTIQYVPTGAQRINAVKAQDLDLGQITSVDVPEALNVIKSGGLEGRDVVLAASVQALMLRASRPALASRELRQAIAFAIDKEAISEGLYGGTCDATDQYFSKEHWAHSDKADAVADYDPDKARQLVAASGVKDPSFELVYYAIYEQPVQVLQAQLDAVGIKVALRKLEPSEALGGFRRGDYDATYATLGASAPDPAAIMSNVYLGGSALVPEADKAAIAPLAAEAADATMDQDDRADLYEDIFAKITEGAYAVPICYSHQVWLNRGDVSGVDRILFTAYGSIDLRYLFRPAG